jgi:hypothetical protein
MFYDDDDDYYYRLLRERRHYRYDRDRRYWDWPTYYPDYDRYYGGQYSSVNQGLYNSGYMSDSGQSSIVNQYNK